MRELGGLSDENVLKHYGKIDCDAPNEFLDKWDGVTQVLPGLPGSGSGGTPPVIVGRR